MNKYPYTYTVLRYVHDISTGEFANVGVLVCSPEGRFACAHLNTSYGRLSKIFPGMNGDHFRSVVRHVQHRFDELSKRLKDELSLDNGPVNAHSLAFSVIAPDDSSFQWSPMGSGITADLSAALNSIYQKMVERYAETQKSDSRSDDQIWKTFRRQFEQKSILSRLAPKTIVVKDDEVQFAHAWKNSHWQCMEALSFDLKDAQAIKNKAHVWLGKVTSVQEANNADPFEVAFLVGEPQLASCKAAFNTALNILNKLPVEHEIVRESECEAFVESVAQKMAAHDAETLN